VGQFGVMTEPNGFYYMRARYYDPQVGRFISEDPIGFDGGDVNLYAYVSNNPINLVDPDGRLAAQVIGGLVGGAFGAYSGYTSSNGDWGQALRSGLVGAGAGVLSAIPIPGINPLLGGMAMSATAGFLGNVGAQLVAESSTGSLKFESAGWSALAGGLGGFFGSSTVGVTTKQGLPILTQYGNEVVGSIVGGISAGGLDARYQRGCNN
jgi:RHS repeat-associated protein